MVGLHDHLAQIQSDAHAAAAVRPFPAAGPEQIKDMFPVLFGNSAAFIADRDSDFAVIDAGTDINRRTGRCVFHGVVEQVVEHLHNQTRVHQGKQRLLGQIENDLPFRMRAEMPDAFEDNILNILRRDRNPGIRFKLCHRQDVFHLPDQPAGILADVIIDFTLVFLAHQISVFHQVCGIAVNRRQRRAQIM